MIPLEDCCYICGGCGTQTCRDERPSPGEDAEICGECVDNHGPYGDCACCYRAMKPAALIEALREALEEGPAEYDPQLDPSIDRTPKPCSLCNGTGWVESMHFYTGEVTRTRCDDPLNHPKEQ